MQRIPTIALTLATAAALLLPQAWAQTPSSKPHKHHHYVRHTAPQTSLTEAQREEVKGLNVKFAACRSKTNAQKLEPKERRAFMKSCLAAK
jgi:hypothetical protein